MKRRYRPYLHAVVLTAILIGAQPRPAASQPVPAALAAVPPASPAWLRAPGQRSPGQPSRPAEPRPSPSPDPGQPIRAAEPGQSPPAAEPGQSRRTREPGQPPRAPEPGQPSRAAEPGQSPAPAPSSESQPVDPPEPEKPDLTPRLREIYERRARRFLTDWEGPPLEEDFLLERKTAQWALLHEEGKYRYVKAWAEARGVRFVEARTRIWVKELKMTEDRARFYVAQALQLGYQYPGEEAVNRFGVGSRHIVELHRTADGRWLIGLEWYSDPLGDETEAPAELPARRSSGNRGNSGLHAVTALAAQRYDRRGAVEYADTYCGLAAGCGNDHKYNPKFRNYMGEGGDCANFVSQALRYGGKLQMPLFTRADALIGHLRYAGKGDLAVRGDFGTVWRIAAGRPEGFRSFLKPGDVLGYEEKGKMTHVALITGFDSRGYPVANSHTADRYRVPFDLGWDRKTIYWFVAMRD